ncbi:DHH family phosphoesterase [Methanolobus sp.]|jgi:single-stranded-DNA-specific exonuclease|uniref:single-stranded-DNA-specific exonuclease RecJ n=1 Tax=Methanolobus sp. TaxID=1874737 RepID=UPI0025E8707D|nr:DHH family phosphoesterase [Methanolobus sp.]
MNLNIEMQKLKELAREAADKIEKYEHVRIISHNDADGLTSAGIICQALMRKGIHFHVSIVPRLDKSVVDMVKETASDGDLVLFCDMGSGQSDIISEIKQDIVVLDHHVPVGETPAKVFVNPHLVGIDGAMHISGSGVTFFVAMEMEPANVDLAGLAIAGAVGDKQLFNTLNGHILEEAVNAEVVSVKKGLKVGDGDLAKVLEYTPEPYLDITGDSEKIEQFLDFLGISGNIEDLNPDHTKSLTSAIALKLAKNASPEAVDAAIGDLYILNKEIVHNVYDLVAILNTCGKAEKGGMGLSICMKDKTHLEEAIDMTISHQISIVENIKKGMDMVKQGNSIGYLIGEDMESTGMIASTFVRYVNPEMPFIAVNQVEGLVKVSARGTRALVEKGLDLSFALREAAKLVGGEGGGHNVASGASIPPGTAEQFIAKVDEIVAEQLPKQGKAE